jgi:hypothetical protein
MISFVVLDQYWHGIGFLIFVYKIVDTNNMGYEMVSPVLDHVTDCAVHLFKYTGCDWILDRSTGRTYYGLLAKLRTIRPLFLGLLVSFFA